MENKYTSKTKEQPGSTNTEPSAPKSSASNTTKSKAAAISKPDANRDISATIVPECNPNNGAFFEELSNPLSSKGN